MEGYSKDEGEQGERQTKVVSVIPEMECYSGRVFPEVVQIHPKTNQEWSLHDLWAVWPVSVDMSVPGMAAPLLERLFPIAKRKG
jgi:hypothetical protein